MKKILIALGIASILFILSVLRPVCTCESNSVPITGQLEFVFEGGVKDACFKFEGDRDTYYINRGLENGLDLKELHQNLTGQQVTLHYAKHWTLLDPQTTIHHVTQLEHDGEILYTEF